MENDPLGEIVYYSRDRRAIIQNFLEVVIPNALHHQRQMSIMGEIGKVELDFSGLFVNVPESAIIMSLACTSPIYPLLGNLQLIKPDKVSVSGNQNCANMCGINIAINMEYFTFRGRLP